MQAHNGVGGKLSVRATASCCRSAGLPPRVRCRCDCRFCRPVHLLGASRPFRADNIVVVTCPHTGAHTKYMLRACQPDLGFFGFEAYFAHQAWLSDAKDC